MGTLAHTEFVVYTVRITDSGPNSWYKDLPKKPFKCVLDLMDRPFNRGKQIVFKVLEAYHPVKHILQHHCEIIEQHIASSHEITELYHGNRKS